MPLTVAIAPDSFKGSLPATMVARAIAEGWRTARPADDIRLLPQADGGEGTLDAIEAAVPGAARRSAGAVTGPDGRPTPGEWLELPGSVAVVELAVSSGLPLMSALDPARATTRGLGEVIRAAIDSGAASILIGLGGSASTDGAAGALSALGARFLDARGAEVPDGGMGLSVLDRIDLTSLIAPPPGGVTLLTDVDNPLLGPLGAAAAFGPQKGADAAQVRALDTALSRLALALGGDPLARGAGAAGGAGYGFAAAWGATIEPGAAFLTRLSGLPAALAAADVVITGEGRFDASSLGGKLVGEVLALADTARVRAGVIAGQIATAALARDGSSVWMASLAALAGGAEESRAHPEFWLRTAGEAAARALSPTTALGE